MCVYIYIYTYVYISISLSIYIYIYMYTYRLGRQLASHSWNSSSPRYASSPSPRSGDSGRIRCLHFSICACHPCAGANANLLCIVPSLTDDTRRESNSNHIHSCSYVSCLRHLHPPHAISSHPATLHDLTLQLTRLRETPLHSPHFTALQSTALYMFSHI